MRNLLKSTCGVLVVVCVFDCNLVPVVSFITSPILYCYSIFDYQWTVPFPPCVVGFALVVHLSEDLPFCSLFLLLWNVNPFPCLSLFLETSLSVLYPSKPHWFKLFSSTTLPSWFKRCIPCLVSYPQFLPVG